MEAHMTDLVGQVGELMFTIRVTNSKTGKDEEHTLVGSINQEQLKELQNGSDTLNTGA